MLNIVEPYLARKGKAFRPAARKALNAGHIKSKWAFPRTTCIGIRDIMCQRGWVQPEGPIGLASFLGETIHGVCVLSTELALGFGRL